MRLLFFLLVLFFGQLQFLCATQSIDLQKIHEIIFGLYFPDSLQLSTVEKRQRQEWCITLWYVLQKNAQAMALLNLLQPNSPLLSDDVKKPFIAMLTQPNGPIDTNLIKKLQYFLRRHPDNNVRQFSARIRNLYSYLVYSSPLTLKIAGYDVEQEPVVAPQETSFSVPPTKLLLQQNEIHHAQGEIDYLVIGSGPAGSLIAHELLEKKPELRVVLLDAGPFVIPQSVPTESSSELMESCNMRTTSSGDIIVRNGRAFGGGTIVNLDLAFSPLLPQIQTNIQSWVDLHLIDGALIHAGDTQDWKNLENAYSYVRSKIGTRTVGVDEVNKNNKILLDGMSTACTYDLNARNAACSTEKNLKISALDVFIIPALKKGLSIVPEVKVRKIMYTDAAAAGVEIEFQQPLSKSYTLSDVNNFNAQPGSIACIRAKHIIVCSGTLGSAELLLRSEIPNSNIGKGIVMHPSMGMYGRFNQEINPLKGLSAAIYAPCEHKEDGYFFESMSADPSFIALVNPGSGHQILDIIRDAKYLGGFGLMLIDTVSKDNKVFINPETNQVEIFYSLSQGDKCRLRKGLIKGLELLFDQGAHEVHIPSSEPLLTDDDCYIPFTKKEEIAPAINRLQFIENQNFISSAHMQGSNKMGWDPQESVVSHNFKVWNQQTGKEFENLYVCDSSIFPTSIGANPMQSIYTFAKLFVDKHLAV